MTDRSEQADPWSTNTLQDAEFASRCDKLKEVSSDARRPAGVRAWENWGDFGSFQNWNKFGQP